MYNHSDATSIRIFTHCVSPLKQGMLSVVAKVERTIRLGGGKEITKKINSFQFSKTSMY